MMSGVNVVAYNSSSKLIILSNTILCVWFMLFLLIFSPLLHTSYICLGCKKYEGYFGAGLKYQFGRPLNLLLLFR